MTIEQYPTSNNVINTLTWRYNATGGETTLSGTDSFGQALSYTAGTEQVFVNGVLIIRNVDYTASNGSSVTLTQALNAGDIFQVYAISPYNVSQMPAASITGTLTSNQLFVSGTTTQRTATSPSAGTLYFDTTLQQLFIYTAYGWATASASPFATVSGGVLTSDTTYYYRTFTSTGSLSVSNATLTADMLVISGGGAGNIGKSGVYYGEGGGAGQVTLTLAQSLPISTYSITVGAGGASMSNGNLGADGYSGTASQVQTFTAGTPGGGGLYNTGYGGTSGNGFIGGAPNATAGGGGGGASVVGGSAPNSTTPGNGGNGLGGTGYTSYAVLDGIGAATSTGQLSSSHYYYGGGGGGTQGNTIGSGGLGGGGGTSTSTVNATANTGGGGAAGSYQAFVPGTGGSGLVVIRYTRASVGG
jgi:hypothetical protein